MEANSPVERPYKEAYEEPIEGVYKFWLETKTGTWPELYELIAEDLSTGSLAALEEAIAVLRCAAFRERFVIPEQYNQEPDHR